MDGELVPICCSGEYLWQCSWWWRNSPWCIFTNNNGTIDTLTVLVSTMPSLLVLTHLRHTAPVGNVYLQHIFFQPVYPCFYSNYRSTSWLQVHLHTVPDEWQLPGSGPAVRDPPKCNSHQYCCSGQHGGVWLSDWPVPQLRLTDRKTQQQRDSLQWSSDEWLCQTGILRHADTVSCHWSVINSDSQWSFHNDGLEFTVSLCPLCISFL